jgi:ABC-2 type transport system permease protein
MTSTLVRALLRKQAVESRWVLGVSALAFLGLSILTAWLTWRFERLINPDEPNPAVFRRYRFLRALGGENMDYSTTALEVCWWNHPLIVLTVLGWAMSRGAAAVAGEIERGTLDLTLSRPVARSTYLLAQVAFAVGGLVLLAGALIAGSRLGALFYALKDPPSVLTLLRPAAMIVTLGMAVYGYTLPFSTLDVVRWRPGLIASAITLGGLIAMTVAPQFEGYDWLEKLSVFNAYAPVTVALKGDPLAFNATVLCGVFAAGVILALVIFARRDLPTNS